MKNGDVKLIQRVLEGDDTAFSTLVRKYQKSVHALVWRKIGDFHIAEDLTQDTFLKAYQKLATLKAPQSFASWLYVIATNHCKTWLRKKRLSTQALQDTGTVELERAAYAGYVIEENEQRITDVQHEVVKKLLAKLQESDRTIITLYYLGEMTYEEISQFLGVSVSAVKNRLYRARQSLKKEEPIVREALGNFQITPNLTGNIMQEIARIKPVAPSSGKPLMPWAVAASTIVAMLLMLGIGNQQYAIRFQQPYSLDTASEMTVELIEAPLVLHRVSKPDTRTQIESINASHRSNKSKQASNNNTAARVAEAHADETIADYTKWELPKEAKVRLGKGDIKRIRFSPDGNELAVASSIGIWMYSVATGDEIALLTGHTADVRNIAFSPDGRILASAGNDRTLRLWDTNTGQQLAVLSDGRVSPWSIAFSHDSTTIASGSRTIQVWNVDTGNPIATLTGHTESIGALAFSPDGKILASASWDMSIKLWDIATEEQLSTHSGQTFVFSPDGKTIAVISEDPTTQSPEITNDTPQESDRQGPSIRLLNIATGEHLSTLKGETLAFSPDGKILASRDTDGTIQLSNPATGEPLRTCVPPEPTDTKQRPPIVRHPAPQNKRLVFSPNGSTLLSLNDYHTIHTVQLWNVADGRLLSTTKTHTGPSRIYMFATAFSRDKPIFMSADETGAVHTWKTTTGEHLSTFTHKGHEDWGSTLGFSADATTLMSLGSLRQGNTVRSWDIDGNKEFTPMELSQLSVSNASTFSPDGKTLAGVTDDTNTIGLWDLQTGTQRATLVGHTWFVETLVFSSDSRLLASGDRTGAIYVWDTASGHRKKTLKGHRISVKALVFSPDNNILASASHRGVRLWDIGTSTLRATLIEHEDSGQADTLALAFSPDGKKLATVGRGKILLWDVDTHRLLSELARRGPGVVVLTFSPDSSILLIGCGEGTIEIWDTSTYTLKSTIKPHTGRIQGMRFSADGQTLASSSMDGTILLWHWASIVQRKKTN